MSNATAPKRLAFFERYLTLWVFLCIIAGVALGKLAPGLTATLSGWSSARARRSTSPSPCSFG